MNEVPGETTRPTTDKNKEKVFNILGQFFDSGRALDLFSGSGALGIEALSRGIKHSTFVDLQPKSVQTIKENLKSLKIDGNRYKVVLSEAMQFIKTYQGEPFDLIFLDPPYAKNINNDLIDLISFRKLLTPSGVIICENEKNTVLNDRFGELVKQREAIEGITKFTFFLWEETV